MNQNSTSLFHAYKPKHLPENSRAWVHQLSGPTKLVLQGTDPTRYRVIVTLIHGNEPSGFEAVYQYLKSQQTPVCNTIIYFPNVLAAQKTPIFSHRNMLDGQDLNRCFSNTNVRNSDSIKLANELLKDIQFYQPEAILDIHNTSGDGPAFAVSTQESHLHKLLMQGFTDKLIITNLKMNALMEQDIGCPIITIEAGGRQQLQSHQTAYRGINYFLQQEQLFDMGPMGQKFLNSIDVLRFPHRLEIKPDASLGYAIEPLEHTDITVVRDIELHNFSKTNAGEMLAWCRKDPNLFFEIGHEGKKIPLNQYFDLEGNQLVCKYDMRLFMCTSHPDIAKSDCLLYFILAN